MAYISIKTPEGLLVGRAPDPQPEPAKKPETKEKPAPVKRKPTTRK